MWEYGELNIKIMQYQNKKKETPKHNTDFNEEEFFKYERFDRNK